MANKQRSSASFRIGLWLVAAVLAMVAPITSAQDVMTLEGALIRGDQESPTVMYLVPWQPPFVQSLERSEGDFMIERGIVPLERSQFRRMLSYHERFKELNPAVTDAPSAGNGTNQ